MTESTVEKNDCFCHSLLDRDYVTIELTNVQSTGLDCFTIQNIR